MEKETTPPTPTPAEAPEPDLQATVDRLTRELGEMREKWLRARADYDNLGRRHEKERDQLRRLAAAPLAEALIPVYETLEAAARADDGQRRLFDLLRAALQAHGFEAIEDEGMPFDPTRHAAVERVESPLDPDTVLETVVRGFSLHGAVLRPAQVKVAAAPTRPTPSKEA